MIDGKTFYEILEVEPSSSFETIKKAYRKLSFLYHPDKNNGKDSKFKDINSAYETLQDTVKEINMILKSRCYIINQNMYILSLIEIQEFTGYFLHFLQIKHIIRCLICSTMSEAQWMM